ncbi:MAG: helix-turn-helix domain-containing protein [Calditrichota bacterium]
MIQKRDTHKPGKATGRPQPTAPDEAVSGGADDKGQSERLLTLTEAAYQLGRVHRTTIMRWVKEGKLRCVRLSRKAILFEPGEIERFIREHRSTT